MEGPVGAVRFRGRRLQPARALVSPRSLAVLLLLTMSTIALFALRPALDLDTAAAFYAGNRHFVGDEAWGAVLRLILSDAPFVLLGALTMLYGARRLGIARLWAPTGRGLLFLVVSLGMGPGVLVNAILKDHSHRPRPMQVVEFGGTLPFRPVGRFDGGCARNCSFVSGEGSTGFWTLAPALLVPAPVQPIAIGAALLFGAGTGLLRIAFGGHFLSDTILSAFFTWLVIIATWWAVLGNRAPSDGPGRPLFEDIRS